MCDFNRMVQSIGLDFGAANLAKLAIDVGSVALAHVQGNRMADMAADSARRSEQFQLAALDAQQAQANAQITDHQGLRARQAQIERARLRAAAAESGLAGYSTARVVGEADTAAGFDIAALEMNRQNVNEQYAREREGVRAATRSRLNEIAGTRPTLLGTGLQIAGAGLGYVTRGLEYERLQQNTIFKPR